MTSAVPGADRRPTTFAAASVACAVLSLMVPPLIFVLAVTAIPAVPPQEADRVGGGGWAWLAGVLVLIMLSNGA